uniref:Uncharacterized protein n=1 Tax=Anguilla anguilla TaxID=7936 RepID=A0A0E9VHF6_ANGAN
MQLDVRYKSLVCVFPHAKKKRLFPSAHCNKGFFVH